MPCSKCGIVIGVPIVYKKENRPALRPFAGAVNKEIIKAADLDKLTAKI